MFKKINLTNKTALVTGAGKGLGRACAIALAEAGAKVIILSRTKSDLDKVNKIIKKTKGSAPRLGKARTGARPALKSKIIKPKK